MLVDDIVAAIEAARDKVMAEEVRALTKLGMPRNMAQQNIAARFHLKAEGDEEGGASPEFENNGQWGDNS